MASYIWTEAIEGSADEMELPSMEQTEADAENELDVSLECTNAERSPAWRIIGRCTFRAWGGQA